MSNLSPGGYDAAKYSREQDFLDRWRFARDITDVILSTLPEWSARVGIFGKWGSGKSTVLHFAEQMLREKESIVFYFNPWAIKDLEDLWEQFGAQLSDALSDAGVPIDTSWAQKLRSSGEWLKSTGIDRAAEVAAAALGREKLYEGAFRLLGSWLKYDGPQIRKIREKLGDRRLVVIIDDLDRCTPELLPKLLLSLRELLDLPGFTFLLAFDDEIVATALKDQNPAWTQGSDFLEKILDFRFHLPAVTEAQKKHLLYNAISQYCPFVPVDSLTGILDLLSNNPRKLKALVRGLIALKGQVERHDPDELNWTDVWLAQMLRTESQYFFERLLQGDTLERETGTLFKLLRTDSRKARKENQDDKNDNIRKLADDAGVTDRAKVERLIQLIGAVRSRASVNFGYVCRLAIRPDCITWKEFRAFCRTWEANPSPKVLNEWIMQHAIDRVVDQDDVEQELFETIVTRKGDLLKLAADSQSTEEHDKYTREAGSILQMAEQFLLSSKRLDASRFIKLFGQTVYWIGFRKNLSDAKLRDQEAELLVKLLTACDENMSFEMIGALIQKSDFIDFGDGTALQKKQLYDRCVSLIASKASGGAIKFFERIGGIKLLTERNRLIGVKFCLFHPDSPIWTEPLRTKLLGVIGQGNRDANVYDNVREYFDLLIEGLESGLDTVSQQEIVRVLSDKELVTLLWAVVTSRPIQYRMRINFIHARNHLIQIGTPDSSLKLTEELRDRLEEEQSKQSA